MKYFILIVSFFVYNLVIAANYDLRIINTYSFDASFTLTIVENGKEDLPLAKTSHSLLSGDTLSVNNFKLKRNQKVLIEGLLNSKLKIVKIEYSKNTLDKDNYNFIKIIAAFELDNIPPKTLLQASEELLKEDNLKFYFDTLNFNIDRYPQLGSFIFIDKANSTSLRSDLIDASSTSDSINFDNYEKTIRLTKESSLEFNLQYPKIVSLAAGLSSTKMMDYYWKIDSVFLERWKAGDSTVFHLLDNDESWYSAVYSTLSRNLDNIENYSVLFVSSIYWMTKMEQGNRIYEKTDKKIDAQTNIPAGTTIAVGFNGNWMTSSDFAEIQISGTRPLKYYVQDLTSYFEDLIFRENLDVVRDGLNTQLAAINQRLSQDTTRLIDSYNTFVNSNVLNSYLVPIPPDVTLTASKVDHCLFYVDNIEKASYEKEIEKNIIVNDTVSSPEQKQTEIDRISAAVNNYNSALTRINSITKEMELRIKESSDLILKINGMNTIYSSLLSETIKKNANKSKELDDVLLSLITQNSLSISQMTPR